MSATTMKGVAYAGLGASLGLVFLFLIYMVALAEARVRSLPPMPPPPGITTVPDTATAVCAGEVCTDAASVRLWLKSRAAAPHAGPSPSDSGRK